MNSLMATIDTDEKTFSTIRMEIWDRIILKASVDKYCSENKISLKDLANELNISRAQLYIIFESRSLDLITLIKFQKKFNFSVLNSREVDNFISLLEFDLFPIHQESNLTPTNNEIGRNSYRDEWLRYCRFMKVNSYYSFLYLRHIGGFLWIDDRDYIRKNREKLPYWNIKHRKNSDSVRRIPIYEKAIDKIYSDKKYKKELLDYEYSKKAKINNDFENYSGIDTALYNNDWYAGKKISEYVENALISQIDHSDDLGNNNYDFGINFNYPEKPKKIESYVECINVPIAGTFKKWKYYDELIKNIIHLSGYDAQVKKSHQDYHSKFMKRIYKFIDLDDRKVKEIDEGIGSKESTYRLLRSIFPKQLDYYSKNKHELFISGQFSDEILQREAILFIMIKDILESNGWGTSEDVTGEQLSNKKYYCDLIAFKDSESPDKETDGVQFTFKIYKTVNTLQVSTIERIKKTTASERGGWDKHIIISNLPYSLKCLECAKDSNVTLITEEEIPKLMDYMHI